MSSTILPIATAPENSHRLNAVAGASLNRRALLASFALFGAASLMPGVALAEDDLSREMILNDPADPIGGNPRGDVTIVSFFDYNCPYCKRTVEPLKKVVSEDGKVRVVYKDWPILTTPSIYGAKLALAAHYQKKYIEAHDAMMALAGSQVTEQQMRAAVAAAALDMPRLEQDMRAKEADIAKLLKRHGAQADGLGLQGTPVFLIGQFLVASALDEAGFKQVISDARDRAKKG